MLATECSVVSASEIALEEKEENVWEEILYPGRVQKWPTSCKTRSAQSQERPLSGVQEALNASGQGVSAIKGSWSYN
jgi:hypothetical protein